jgi:hypothetical protein
MEFLYTTGKMLTSQKIKNNTSMEKTEKCNQVNGQNTLEPNAIVIVVFQRYQ